MDRFPDLSSIPYAVAEQITFDLKYSGYVERQQVTVDRQLRLAEKQIPADFDYRLITHLRHEAREKLDRVRPRTIAQAQRISGITPADITLVLLHVQQRFMVDDG